ncbi:WD40-repeat-containing domain protein [Polychytrium aggregatum]|uniref:WD40-repeat-containing domain protein n=1 Tax=Polychytrium aggregatum TaxID=110093 RepID=UPI0022FEA3FD|nr:WD40-repeat-containing domain protein [Polychytrium aggregatum]KAI9204097.1 WD40-repeat-containing domain protein [Polychytrium aggregatum]
MIHDAQLDYYGKKLATCSSDRSIRIFEVEEENQRLVATLPGHQGPVWQVAWAHPKFGNLLASCSYDATVIIWKETNGTWARFYDHTKHTASVNSIAWGPHEYGLTLLCGSADGTVSLLSFSDEMGWYPSGPFSTKSGAGINAVSWAPSSISGSIINSAPANSTAPGRRFVTGGCDTHVRLWREEGDKWENYETLEKHSDWVRDVSWAPNLGIGPNTIATASQDKTVLIWTETSPQQWTSTPLRSDGFPDVVWRVSWSVSGNILAVTCGDNTVTLWKENLDGVYSQIGELKDQAASN